MKCPQAQEWMSEKLDGALDATRSQRLDQHLYDCSGCHQEWRELQQSWELLGRLPELQPSPLFRAQVWEKIRQDKVPTIWSVRRWLGGLGLTLAGFALCFKLTAAPPLASPTLPPPQVSVNLSAGELQEWDAGLEIVPSLDSLIALEESPLTAVPLGDFSHDYFAMDDTLEGL
jgi:anti-sigma factor RsiW